ncbi:MAG: ECF-type sigma factor [Gemmataceae bacterium]
MSDITRILKAAEEGDPQAASKLLPLVYDELRRLAAARLAGEKPGQTLDATGLVHEAYLRLVADSPGRPWSGRVHFFMAAAEAMRRILIERARYKRRLKRGGDRARVPLDEAQLAEEADDRLLEVDESLDRLAAENEEVAAVVKLRYFVGLTIEEAAEALGISVRQANRHWAYARAWLFQQLQ